MHDPELMRDDIRDKEYERWHREKARINRTEGTALFHEREVWWCALGANVGCEQDGGGELFTRPVVVVTKFNLDACLIVPLTSRPKEGKYYFSTGEFEERDAMAVLSQVRFVDRRRLVRKIAMLDKQTFKALNNAIVKACFPHAKP